MLQTNRCFTSQPAPKWLQIWGLPFQMLQFGHGNEWLDWKCCLQQALRDAALLSQVSALLKSLSANTAFLPWPLLRHSKQHRQIKGWKQSLEILSHCSEKLKNEASPSHRAGCHAGFWLSSETPVTHRNLRLPGPSVPTSKRTLLPEYTEAVVYFHPEQRRMNLKLNPLYLEWPLYIIKKLNPSKSFCA